MTSGEHAKAWHHCGGALLAPKGLAIAVCDESSDFNRTSINTDAWEATRLNSADRLFEYNSFMCQQMSSRHAVVWILVLWGIFRLRVVLHVQVDQLPSLASSNLLIGNCREAQIEVTSGRLGWIDIEKAANAPWRHIAEVPPGVYLCRLTGTENPNHWDLADSSEYPPDGEDWVLHLVKVADSRSETLGERTAANGSSAMPHASH